MYNILLVYMEQALHARQRYWCQYRCCIDVVVVIAGIVIGIVAVVAGVALVAIVAKGPRKIKASGTIMVGCQTLAPKPQTLDPKP